MDRGCGFMTFHFATYVGDAFSKEALAWNGGYIKYDGPNPESYSTYKTLETDVIFPSPRHEVMRGLQPFHIKEEFYYKVAFVPERQGVTALLRVPNLPVDSKGDTTILAKPEDQIPLWAFERKDGGRSIGATFGHSYSSWKNDDYRKLVLNAIVWTAKIKVPKDGVESIYLDEAEVEKVLGPLPVPIPSPLEPLKTP
jgi:type 1 glutamine amidotransferase